MAADHSTTHFERFGLAKSFDVDLDLLDERYRASQRAMHPDRFANATDQERRISMQQATLINEGYQILKDPLKRGRYLLQLAGRSFDDEHHTNSDINFLMEQMELREALDEVRNVADAFAELGVIIERIADDIARLASGLQQQFSAGDADSLDLAADSLTKMQFYRKLQEEAMELELELEDELAG
ncbi:MAG: Fe-S protein assembly co-chaperone HscB [Gammaproteobacteria bacterium]|jgi:molecular chaperone HscB|nr:Fe-S protein assembly co-chaperone HscB [Gammaproteobacteria bacterium]